MGFIKFRGEVVYEGPIAKWTINPNWCDSMAEYYPYIVITYMKSHDEKTFVRVQPSGWNDPNCEQFEVEIDKDQLSDLLFLEKRIADKKEAETIRLHKLVRVVKGRKVPIGTEGEVFWMGDNGYGMSVGLRLIDGKRVFTAMSNVKTVQLDEVFESVVLK